MKAVACVAGEPHSGCSKCADPVITRLATWLNDSCGDALRQELLQGLSFRIAGTKSTWEIERERAFMAADWAVRFVCPLMLRVTGLEFDAQNLERLEEVNCARAARAASAAAYTAAAAAYDAASTASVTFAVDVFIVAAAVASAARSAARAAFTAAYAAAAASAYDAASTAASAASAADLERIQRSCAALLDRMIRLTEPVAP